MCSAMFPAAGMAMTHAGMSMSSLIGAHPCAGASDTLMLLSLGAILFFLLVATYFAIRLMAFVGQPTARRFCDASHIVLALGMIEMFGPAQFTVVPLGVAAGVCFAVGLADGLIALQIHRGAMNGTGQCIKRCAVDGGMAIGMGYMFSTPALQFGWARLLWIGYFAALALWQLGLAVRLVPAVREYERSAAAWAARSSQDHPTPRLLQSICQLGMGAAMLYMFTAL
jgi:Domain of unknown function (DUF5134)